MPRGLGCESFDCCNKDLECKIAALASSPLPQGRAVSVDVAAVAALFDQAVDFFNAQQFVERVIHP